MDAMWKEILQRQFGAAMDMFENALRECSARAVGQAHVGAVCGILGILVRGLPHALLGRPVPGWDG